MVVLSSTLITTVSFHFIQQQQKLTWPLYRIYVQICCSFWFFLLLKISPLPLENHSLDLWSQNLYRSQGVLLENTELQRCWPEVASSMNWQLTRVWYQQSLVIDVPSYCIHQIHTVNLNFPCSYTWKWMNPSAPFKQSSFYQHCHLNIGYQPVYIHQSQKWTLVHRKFLLQRISNNQFFFFWEKDSLSKLVKLPVSLSCYLFQVIVGFF